MLNERALCIAERYDLTERVQKLQKELLQVEGVEDVDFDLDGFLSDIPEVIFLLKYDIPVTLADYFKRRRALLNEAVRVTEDNGLKRTQDVIEDYGQHFYIVTQAQAWNDP